jgi:hypothetical protein
MVKPPRRTSSPSQQQGYILDKIVWIWWENKDGGCVVLVYRGERRERFNQSKKNKIRI